MKPFSPLAGTKNIFTDVKLLMVRVQNLEGDIVWTFPKGHLEKGEGYAQAALREVWEETGWKCRIEGPTGKYFEKARYMFKRSGHPVKKEVAWYLMSPLKKTGRKDAEEILNVRWFSVNKAGEKASYGSDVLILEKLKKFLHRRAAI